jgi:hypothetical protein
MPALFLEPDELVRLTGRRFKSHQIKWLRKQAIPFRVSATGHPVVIRSAIDTTASQAGPVRTGWAPRVIAGA